MKRVCIFCGSRSGEAPTYRETAQRLGRLLVAERWGLVYGAGHVGLMGMLADAVLAAGGEVIGVIPQALVDRELAHQGLTALHVVETMHQRKALMADLADAFIALPGGFGTADELFEILTWAQLGIHTKPIGLLNVDGFFDPLLAWLDLCVREQFLRPVHRALLQASAMPEALLVMLRQPAPAKDEPKWARPGER